jgi:hypothetical protein
MRSHTTSSEFSPIFPSASSENVCNSNRYVFDTLIRTCGIVKVYALIITETIASFRLKSNKKDDKNHGVLDGILTHLIVLGLGHVVNKMNAFGCTNFL